MHRLENDLYLARCLDYCVCQQMPVSYNYMLQGGYFVMPSARMGAEGEIGFGFAHLPPYNNWSARFQYLSNLEITGSYRVFKGIPDPLFGHLGFGDLSDKGANLKYALWLPHETDYLIPSVAIGFDDIMGTQAFKSRYIVATQVFPDFGLEVSIGWGEQRIKGFFGGVLWMPFWSCDTEWMKGLTFAFEVDGTDYKHDPHPDGRYQRHPINWGIKYRIKDYVELSCSQIRGDQIACGISTSYNLGFTEGFLPKIDDRLPYKAPADLTPLGDCRPETWFAAELAFTMCDHGFTLRDLTLHFDECNNRTLRVVFENEKYRTLYQLREQLTAILAHLLPDNIDRVVAVLKVQDLEIQEWAFWGEFLRAYRTQAIGFHELAILSPLKDVSSSKCFTPYSFYKKPASWWEWSLEPRTHTFFGSSKGKFKYALGIALEADGFLTKYEIFYRLRLSYLFVSDLDDCADVDILNPSQLINVHTDIIDYEKQRGIRVDALYIQKNWQPWKGFYTRSSIGFFNEGYVGISAECLYYPVCSTFAIGFEIAVIRKRQYDSIFGIMDQARKLVGYTPTYLNFLGTQGFLDLYYDWRACDLLFEVNIGKFLANDVGVRFIVDRYFPSGLDLFFWYTVTNANDMINGHIYYDKGVGLSMPLDMFYMTSSKERWGYEMSAWLRDCGYRTDVGDRLFPTLFFERQ
jgi:Bacterial putative lipoprotein (DUF940).